MVRRLSIIIGISLLCAAVPRSALSQSWECGERSNLPQQGMNHCAWQDYRQADRVLNKAWQTLRKNSAQESGRPDLPLEAQRAWLTFRDKQCEAEGSKFEGGSLQPFIISTCLTRLTYNRVDEIQRFAEDL